MGTALVAVTYGMTSGRVGPTVVALVALVGVVAGGVALRRGRGGVVALVLGLVGAVAGAVFAATADGGPGTGNGIVGALAALLLGIVAVVLGGVALTRRAAHEPQRVDA